MLFVLGIITKPYQVGLIKKTESDDVYCLIQNKVYCLLDGLTPTSVTDLTNTLDVNLLVNNCSKYTSFII